MHRRIWLDWPRKVLSSKRAVWGFVTALATALTIFLSVFTIENWPSVLAKLQLQPAISTEESLFGFSEYLAALALLLIVLSISDFKYRLRFQLAMFNLQYVAFILSAVIGVTFLAVDLWFHNGWLVPAGLNDANNIRIGLALLFFSMVL